MNKRILIVAAIVVLAFGAGMGIGFMLGKHQADEADAARIQNQDTICSSALPCVQTEEYTKCVDDLSQCKASQLDQAIDEIQNQYDRQTAFARDARRKADINELRTALELYYYDYNAYPVVQTIAELEPLITPGYLVKMPTDPLVGRSYRYTSTPSEYVLRAELETDEKPYEVTNVN